MSYQQPIIPKIIHQTWKSDQLPEPIHQIAETWKEFHPDWQYILWTDEMNRDFIKEYFPGFLRKYDNYPRTIQRVDAFRYCVLDKLGGLYVDIDFECLDNIEPLLNGKKCVVGKEPRLHAERFSREMILCNAFMASVPGDRFMRYVCDKVMSYPDIEVRSPVDILDSTGPFLLTDSFSSYDKQDEVSILESSVIYPITMFETDHLFQETIPGDIQERLNNAYAVHYFLGNW